MSQMKLKEVRFVFGDGDAQTRPAVTFEHQRAMEALAQKGAPGTQVGNLRATEIQGGVGGGSLSGLGDLVMVVQ